MITTYNLNAQENCGNGKDDDGDGLIDCLDKDCTGNPPDLFYFNTGSNGMGGVLPGGAQDLSWKFATSYTGLYNPAIVLSSKPGTYYLSPWPDADWISFSALGNHNSDVDYYFKNTFLLPCYNSCGSIFADSGIFCLTLDYFSDNSVYEIWVNGKPQSSRIKTIPVSNPYSNVGFKASGMLTASLCQDWKPGLNEIIIRVSSGPNYLGLLVQATTKTGQLPTATIGGTTTVCQNDPPPVVTFTASGKAPFTFSYSINHGNTQTVSTTGNTVNISVPTNKYGVFTYSLLGVKDAYSNSCAGALNDSASITIKQSPLTNAGSDQTICIGTSTILTATGGTSYQWMNGPATNTYTVSPITTTAYTVTAYLNGCSASHTITITVKPNPIIVLEPDSVRICQGNSIALKAKGASTYNWFPSSGLKDTTGAIVIASPVTTTTYNVTGTLNGCKATSTVVVNIEPTFPVNIGENTTICPNSSIILNSGYAGATHLWSTGDTTPSISVSLPGKYWVEVKKGPCTVSDSIQILLQPDMSIEPYGTGCNGTITLRSNLPASSYLWSTGQTTAEIKVKEPGKYWLIVDITNCKMKDTFDVHEMNILYNTLYYPNTFTPNNDGINDIFAFKGSVKEFHLIIFNRWGEKIFETYDINTGWDGTTPYGNLVEDGVYVWIVQYKYEVPCPGETPNPILGLITVSK